MIRLVKEQFPAVEHKIANGPLAGCVLVCRRPTYADLLAEAGARDMREVYAARLKLVEGWKGKDGEPSPFEHADGKPVAYSAASLADACERFPSVLGNCLDAAEKAYAAAGTNERELGESAPPPAPG